VAGPSRRVLVVGSGGREHALAWKLASDGAEVLIAPGNAGTAQIGENVAVTAGDIPGLVGLARSRAVDLTVIGPERDRAVFVPELHGCFCSDEEITHWRSGGTFDDPWPKSLLRV
jgi:phosphoribosylamine--glycine ligase